MFIFHFCFSSKYFISLLGWWIGLTHLKASLHHQGSVPNKIMFCINSLTLTVDYTDLVPVVRRGGAEVAGAGAWRIGALGTEVGAVRVELLRSLNHSIRVSKSAKV